MTKSNGVSAWLVTWEWSGDHAKPPNKVAEILSPRLGIECVRQITELLYHREALLSEKITWRLRHQQQPYPAEISPIHGIKWGGEITCGHNPWLRARLVDNLIISTDENGQETASWTDRHSPRGIAEQIRCIQTRSGRTD